MFDCFSLGGEILASIFEVNYLTCPGKGILFLGDSKAAKLLLQAEDSLLVEGAVGRIPVARLLATS